MKLTLRPVFATVLVLAAAPGIALAQAEGKPPEIAKVQVGFQSLQREEATAFKVGLFAPIYVHVFGGSEGIAP